MGELTFDQLVEVVLIAHQRRDAGSCLCGWARLGASHAGHQAAKLREAELLGDDPAVAGGAALRVRAVSAAAVAVREEAVRVAAGRSRSYGDRHGRPEE